MNNNTIVKNGIGMTGLVFIVFLTLKLGGVINTEKICTF